MFDPASDSFGEAPNDAREARALPRIRDWTFGPGRSTFSAMPFRVLAADHTGITVSDIERSLVFWRDVLGFELSHRAHQKGALAEQITGVAGAEILIAVVKAPGHKIELLEYRAPADRRSQSDLRPCDLGHVHVALTVENLDELLETIAASGWKAAGQPQTLKTGPNAGKRVIYVRDPDGTTLEFMQPPAFV